MDLTPKAFDKSVTQETQVFNWNKYQQQKQFLIYIEKH